MYTVTMLEVDRDNWWTIEIESPGGSKIKYRQLARDKADIEPRINAILDRLNNEYMQMHARVKGGWRQSRDEGRNQVYSETGRKKRDKRREMYRNKLKAHFAERRAAIEKAKREADDG